MARKYGSGTIPSGAHVHVRPAESASWRRHVCRSDVDLSKMEVARPDRVNGYYALVYARRDGWQLAVYRSQIVGIPPRPVAVAKKQEFEKRTPQVGCRLVDSYTPKQKIRIDSEKK